MPDREASGTGGFNVWKCCKSRKVAVRYAAIMQQNRPVLFKGQYFEAEIIVLCVRWYPRFRLSFRNLEEMMACRNLQVDVTRDLIQYVMPGAEMVNGFV